MKRQACSALAATLGGLCAVFTADAQPQLPNFATVEIHALQVRDNVYMLVGAGGNITMQVGADGILLLPPYLVNAEQDGLAAHIEAICRATSLGVVAYSRDNAILSSDTVARLCERCPNLVALKDGVGDIELMVRIHLRMAERLVYIGGLPTAETFALPYLEMGVATYSSAIFNFMPVWAKRFFGAVRGGDRVTVQHHLRDFVMPYIGIRNRAKGYAVSIVKAGLDIVGRPAGHVRSPLTDLRPEDRADLRKLIERAQKLN